MTSPLSPVSSITNADSSQRSVRESLFQFSTHDIRQQDETVLTPTRRTPSESLINAYTDGGGLEQHVLPQPRSFGMDDQSSPESPDQTPPDVVTNLSKIQDILSSLQTMSHERTAKLRWDSPAQIGLSTSASATYLRGLDTVGKISEGEPMPLFEDVTAMVDVALVVAFDLYNRGRTCSWPEWYEEVIQLRFLFESPNEQNRFLEVADAWWCPFPTPSSGDMESDARCQRHRAVGNEAPKVKSLRESLVFQLCRHHINGI